METKKYLPLALVALSVLVAFVYYPVLPDPMPSHWNSVGTVDGYAPKSIAVLFMPVLALCVYFFMTLIPKIDPMKENIALFRDDYDNFVLVITAFFSFVYLGTVFWSLGYQISFNLIMLPPLAVLFYFTGDLLGKSKRNFFIGVRTPWTLVDDAVWAETHVVGAKMFKAFGVLFLLLLLSPELMIYLVFLLILGVLYLVYYSYWLHGELAKKGKRKKSFKG